MALYMLTVKQTRTLSNYVDLQFANKHRNSKDILNNYRLILFFDCT